MQESSSKVLAFVFWDKAGILLVNYLEKGATNTTKCYIAFLDKQKQQMAFEKNIMPSRQCCSSLGGLYAPTIDRSSL
jgi:hypothetical protein